MVLGHLTDARAGAVEEAGEVTAGVNTESNQN